MPRFVIAAAALAHLALQSAGPQPPAPPAAPPPGFQVTARAEPPVATVGDRIAIDFEFTLPSGASIQPPALDKSIGEFSVVEVLPGPEIPGAPPASAGKHRARIIVTVYRVGTFELPALQWRLRDARGEEIAVSSPPVKVEIKSVLGPKDTDIKDLKQQADLDEPTRWWLWLVLAAAAVAAAVVAWWLWRRRRRPEAAPSRAPEIDPFAAAEAEIRELLARGLLEKGFVKQFYVGLSEIVRGVVEAGYGVPTAEKTTGEIVDALRRAASPTGEADGFEPIERFLSASDLVKFARYIPPRAEIDAAVTEARAIVQIARSRRAAAAPPAPTAEEKA